MTYYIDSLQIAVHGKAGVLRSLDFAPALREARDKDCDWIDDDMLEESIEAYQKAQKKLANLPEDVTATLEVEGSIIADLSCLNLLLCDHPELKAVAIAEIRWESEYPSPSEYYSFWTEEDVDPDSEICIYDASDICDGYRVLPSGLTKPGYTDRSDWGFPEDWDWIPFDLERYIDEVPDMEESDNEDEENWGWITFDLKQYTDEAPDMEESDSEDE